MLFPVWGQAEELQCSKAFSPEPKPATAAAILNERLTNKFPRLAFVNKNPDLFIKEMQARFEAKKKQDPTRAYEFDYSEIGMPLVKDMAEWLTSKINDLGNETKEQKVARQYLSDLRAEAQTYLNSNQVSYKALIEFSYFYSRAIGHFDTRPQRPLMRLFLFIDRSINGYKQLSITKEYDLYKNRQFNVFQKRSVTKNFRSAEVPFQDLFKQDHLDTIWVPTNESVNREIFMRLMSKNINLIGVTSDPILADGVLRPGGDFFNHDVRHESFKYYERGVYIKRHKLNEQQIQKLSEKSEEWYLEFKAELAKVQDPDFRNAIYHLAFNFHHDAGFPLVPSVYIYRVKDHAARNLYYMMELSGQGAGFKEPLKNLKLADQWLTQFWQARLMEETAILYNPNN